MAYQKVWEEALRIALLMAGLKGQLMLTRRKVYHKKGRQKDLLMVIQMDRNFEGSLVFFFGFAFFARFCGFEFSVTPTTSGGRK